MELAYRGHRFYSQIAETKPDNTFLADASGAFFGAFFAFIFGLVAYFIQKKFDRYHKHTYATVELEYLLQEHLDRSSANQYLLDGAIATISKDAFAFTLLSEFRLPEDISLRLGELALINRYADYQPSPVTMKHAMMTWQKMNEKLHEAAISGALTEVAKKLNQNHLVAQAKDVIKFLKGLDEDTKYLVSYVRVFMRKDKHIWSIPLIKRRGSLKQGDDIVSYKEVKAELKVMEKEIADVQKNSRAKIEKIVNG